MSAVDVESTNKTRSRSRRLATAVSGNIVYAVAQAATLAVVTRSADGAVDAADFLLAQAVATPVAVFISGRVRDQLATEGTPAPLRPRLRRMGVMSALAIIASVLGWTLLADGQSATVGIAIVIANLAQVMVTIYQGRAISADRFGTSSAANIALGALSLASFLIGYYLDGLATGAVLLAGSWTLLGVGLLTSCLREEKHMDFPETGTPTALRDDLLVGLAGTAMVAQPSAARIGVSVADGAAGLATFGTTSTLARLGSLLVNGAKAAISPELGAAVKAGRLDRYLLNLRRRLRVVMLAMMTTGFLVGWFVGPEAIETIFSAAVRPDALTAALVFGLTPSLYMSMLLAQVAIAGNLSTRLTAAAVSGLVVTAMTILPLASALGPAGAALALGMGNLTRYAILDQLLVPADGLRDQP